MKIGDVVFIMHHDNDISKAISSAMNSRWSHSTRIYEVASRGAYVIETTDFEVAFGEMKRYLEDPNCELEVWTCDAITEDEAFSHMEYTRRDLVGLIYPYWQFISLGIRRILVRFGIKIPNFIRSLYTCNEVVLYSLSRSPKTSFYNIDPQSIDTEDMYQQIKADPAFKLSFYKTPGKVSKYPLEAN
jgi:hypothetical protein